MIAYFTKSLFHCYLPVVLLMIGQGYFKKDLEVTALDATIVCLALMGGAEIENLNFAPILMKRLSVRIPS